MYVEPGSVVPGNNELAAARGECFAAEEAVLSRLSMLCAEHAEPLQEVIDVLVWLDVAAAKAEYGLWVNGHVVQVTEWPHERAGGGGPKRDGGSMGKGGGEEESEEEGLVFRLKQLRYDTCLVWQFCFTMMHAYDDIHTRARCVRDHTCNHTCACRHTYLNIHTHMCACTNRHPLLLANHLRDQQRRQRLANSQSGASTRRLSTRKADATMGGDANRPAIPAPVPVDMCVPPGVRGVVITGPNTGGKTATLKVRGG